MLAYTDSCTNAVRLSTKDQAAPLFPLLPSGVRVLQWVENSTRWLEPMGRGKPVLERRADLELASRPGRPSELFLPACRASAFTALGAYAAFHHGLLERHDPEGGGHYRRAFVEHQSGMALARFIHEGSELAIHRDVTCSAVR